MNNEEKLSIVLGYYYDMAEIKYRTFIDVSVNADYSSILLSYEQQFEYDSFALDADNYEIFMLNYRIENEPIEIPSQIFSEYYNSFIAETRKKKFAIIYFLDEFKLLLGSLIKYSIDFLISKKPRVRGLDEFGEYGKQNLYLEHYIIGLNTIINILKRKLFDGIKMLFFFLENVQYAESKILNEKYFEYENIICQLNIEHIIDRSQFQDEYEKIIKEFKLESNLRRIHKLTIMQFFYIVKTEIIKNNEFKDKNLKFGRQGLAILFYIFKEYCNYYQYSNENNLAFIPSILKADISNRDENLKAKTLLNIMQQLEGRMQTSPQYDSTYGVINKCLVPNSALEQSFKRAIVSFKKVNCEILADFTSWKLEELKK